MAIGATGRRRGGDVKIVYVPATIVVETAVNRVEVETHLDGVAGIARQVNGRALKPPAHRVIKELQDILEWAAINGDLHPALIPTLPLSFGLVPVPESQVVPGGGNVDGWRGQVARVSHAGVVVPAGVLAVPPTVRPTVAFGVGAARVHLMPQAGGGPVVGAVLHVIGVRSTGRPVEISLPDVVGLVRFGD